ncbi:MAG: hypothetical protein WAK01_16020 [Methylocystis sp.]
MLTQAMLRRLLLVLVSLGVMATLAAERSSAASIFPSHLAQTEVNF